MKSEKSERIRELDRKKLLDNLDDVIGWKAMTYAEVESAAGVYAGYISRMKADPRKLPALDVIWKMSQVLEVPLAWLIQGTIGDLEENILYVRRFVVRLSERTIGKTLHWQCFSSVQLRQICSGEKSAEGVPFVEKAPDGTVIPVSLAYPEMENRFEGDAFRASLDDSHDVLLCSLQFTEPAEPDEPGSGGMEQDWRELQLLDRNTRERRLIVCTSYGEENSIWEDLETLYYQLRKHVADLRLDDHLRQVIDSFMADNG